VQSGGTFPLGHPTTRLCLDLLGPALAAGPASRLLDVGCGAGVLSLAAAALGVPQVVGVDIALQAARITRDNARHNGLAAAISVAQGSTECLKGAFDLVLANLPWEVQLAKVPELQRLTRSGGFLILSGFRDNQEDLLRTRYRRLGRVLRQRAVWSFQHPELPPGLSFNWVAWWLA
jgi:ribosomal protein L11 methyltransferase